MSDEDPKKPDDLEPERTPEAAKATDDADGGGDAGGDAGPDGALAASEEPIEAEFEPADTSFKRFTERHVSLPVALGLAAAASVLGGVFGVVFDSGDGAARMDSAQIEAVVDERLDGVDARLRALRQTITEAGVEGGGPPAAALADLEAEVAALSDVVEATTSRLRVVETAGGDAEATAALGDQLAALEADVEDARALAEEARAAPDAHAAAIATLTARVDALSESVRAQGAAIDELAGAAGDMAGRITGVRAPSTLATAGAAAALAFATLQEAALTGGPFLAEAQATAAYFAENDDMDALLALAERGAPTPAELAVSFRSAARAARMAERPTGGGVVDRLGRAVSGLVTVRRLDAPATDSLEDVLVRAQRAVARDDIGAAAEELERLSGPAGKAVETWVAEAQARAEISARLDALRASFSEG